MAFLSRDFAVISEFHSKTRNNLAILIFSDECKYRCSINHEELALIQTKAFITSDSNSRESWTESQRLIWSQTSKTQAQKPELHAEGPSEKRQRKIKYITEIFCVVDHMYKLKSLLLLNFK